MYFNMMMHMYEDYNYDILVDMCVMQGGYTLI